MGSFRSGNCRLLVRRLVRLQQVCVNLDDELPIDSTSSPWEAVVYYAPFCWIDGRVRVEFGRTGGSECGKPYIANLR